MICLFPFVSVNKESGYRLLLCMKEIAKTKQIKIPKPIQRKIIEHTEQIYLVTGSTDKETKFWKLKNNFELKLLASYFEHTENINDGCQIDNDSFVTVSVDSTLCVCSKSKKKLIEKISVSSDVILVCSFISVPFYSFSSHSSDSLSSSLSSSSSHCFVNFIVFGCYSGQFGLVHYPTRTLVHSVKLPSPSNLFILFYLAFILLLFYFNLILIYFYFTFIFL